MSESQATSFSAVVPYASNGYADSYCASKLGYELWTTATEAQKTAALRRATLDIDVLPFVGVRVATDQRREWPRWLRSGSYADAFYNSENLPTRVVYSCVEQAYYILKNYLQGYSPDDRRDHQDQGLNAISRAGGQETYDVTFARRHSLCMVAWELIRDFVAKTGNLQDTFIPNLNGLS